MSLGKPVGKFFAHVQHTLDNVASWGFSKLQQASKQDSSGTQEQSGKVAVVKKFLRKGAGILGEAGTSYFEEYEKLKQHQRKK